LSLPPIKKPAFSCLLVSCFSPNFLFSLQQHPLTSRELHIFSSSFLGC
jgi:hypothetical protein